MPLIDYWGLWGRKRQGGGIDRACKLPVGDKDAILGYVRQGRVGHGYGMRKLSIRCTIGVCGYGRCRVWARHWRGLGKLPVFDKDTPMRLSKERGRA